MPTRRQVLSAAGTAAIGTTAGCEALGDDRGPLVGLFPGTTSEARKPWMPVDRWLGRPNAVVTLYFDATSVARSESRIADVRRLLTRVWRSGHVPMVTWQPYLDGGTAAPNAIEHVISTGGYDGVINRWARLLSEWVNAGETRRRVYFRPFPEMNGDWLPWSAADDVTTTKDFVAAWRYVHDRIMETDLSADDIQWIWNPNADNLSGPPAESYYPGDAYVDWVGIDGYNFGSARPWSTWRSPETVFGSMLDRMRDLTDKPITLPEYGTSSYKNGRPNVRAKSAWIRSSFEYLRQRDVRMACWFNVVKETDWAVFGGTRGTATFTTGGDRYRVYRAYRDAVRDSGMVWGDPERDRVVSDRAFRGWA